METHERDHQHCDEYAELSRRGFLGSSRAIAAALVSAPAWLPKVSLARGGGAPRDTMMTIFFRGGMDGLTTCVPYGDGELYNRRPTLAIQPPGSPDGALDLDGFFGLPPAAAPLLTPWNDGKLAIVHAVGSTDPTRSHFDAMNFMESGTPGVATTPTGWLGRHLATTPAVGAGNFRGIALEPLTPKTLAGGPGVLPIVDPDNFAFPGNPATASARRSVIEDTYAEGRQPLKSAAESSLATIDLLDSIDFAGYVPANGAVYPATPFGQSLMAVAAMIKANIGLEAAQSDLGGWDLHQGLGPIGGAMAGLLNQVASTLEAFYLDLQAEMDSIVVVAMSEFGRRIAENGTAGIDHGHGNVMLAMGGHINGGQVLANWTGLINDDNGDVAITTDYRDILAEILQNRMGTTDLSAIFPGYVPTFQGITV